MQEKRKKHHAFFVLLLVSAPALFYSLRFIIVYLIPQSLFDKLLIEYINSVVFSLAKNDYKINYKYYVYSLTLLSIKYIEVDKNKALFSYKRRNECYVIKRLRNKSNEGTIMSKLDNANIVKTYKIFKTSFDDKEIEWIIMEHLDFDINFKYVKKNQRIIKNIALDILNALDYLHDLKIAHLDVKIENIMGKNTKDGVVYKLIDFGYSNYIDDGCIIIKNKNLGTFPYKPPEIVFYSCHCLKSDVWSFGISLFYMLINSFLFFDENESFLFENYKDYIANDKFNYKIIESTMFYDLVKACMITNYNERPNIKEIIAIANKISC